VPGPEQMSAAVHAYIEAFARGDAAMVAALYADDALIEDPVGTPPRAGRAAILQFYRKAMAAEARLVLTGPIRLANAHAAFAMQVRLNWKGAEQVIDVIDTFAFDEAGKIKEMKAYFGPGNFGPNSSDPAGAGVG